MSERKRSGPAGHEAAPIPTTDTAQDTAPVTFDLDSLTAAVASLNRQRIDHGCACRPRAAFVLLPGNWFQCRTTHDDGCPALTSGGGR